MTHYDRYLSLCMSLYVEIT